MAAWLVYVLAQPCRCLHHARELHVLVTTPRTDLHVAHEATPPQVADVHFFK